MVIWFNFTIVINEIYISFGNHHRHNIWTYEICLNRMRTVVIRTLDWLKVEKNWIKVCDCWTHGLNWTQRLNIVHCCLFLFLFFVFLLQCQNSINTLYSFHWHAILLNSFFLSSPITYTFVKCPIQKSV